MDALLDPFAAPFMRRALLALVLLGVAGGLLGTWVVLRRLAFFGHAVGSATLPGLAAASSVGLAPPLAALGSGALFAGLLARLARARTLAPDAATGLLLAVALALGVALASRLEGAAGAELDRLLFGSALGLTDADLALAAGCAGLAGLATWAGGRAWLATGFDPDAAPALGVRVARSDALLLAALAVVVVGALPVVGALLVSAVLVVPAATARLLARSVASVQVLAVALAVAEGVAGLWLAWTFDVPPGPAVATTSGVVFALVALARPRRRPARPTTTAAAGLAVLAGLAGCGEDRPSPRDDGRLVVVATTPLVADLARQVGGSAVTVRVLVPTGEDPHRHEVTPADVEALRESDVILRSGGSVDAWLEDPVGREEVGHRVTDLSTAVVLRLPAPGTSASGADPHWWQDPRNVSAAVEEIRNRLVKADLGQDRRYVRLAARARRRLTRLDTALAACFGRLRPAERRFADLHAGYRYLARRYGLRYPAAEGPLFRVRPGGRRDALPTAVPEEAVPRTALWGDTLGPVGAPEGTYAGARRADADAIAAAASGGRVRCR